MNSKKNKKTPAPAPVAKVVTMPTLVFTAQADIEFAIDPRAKALLDNVDAAVRLVFFEVQNIEQNIEQLKAEIERLNTIVRFAPQRKQDIVNTDIALASVPNVTGRHVTISEDNTTAYIPQPPIAPQKADNQA